MSPFKILATIVLIAATASAQYGGYGGGSAGGLGGGALGGYGAGNAGGYGGGIVGFGGQGGHEVQGGFGGQGGIGGGYGLSGGQGGAIGGGYGHQQEYYHHPKYNFAYAVKDTHTHDIKHHNEHRDGDKTEGEYSLVEPDGTTRTVKYHVHGKSGFVATVHRSGHSVHPQPVHHAPQPHYGGHQGGYGGAGF